VENVEKRGGVAKAADEVPCALRFYELANML